MLTCPGAYFSVVMLHSHRCGRHPEALVAGKAGCRFPTHLVLFLLLFSEALSTIAVEVSEGAADGFQRFLAAGLTTTTPGSAEVPEIAYPTLEFVQPGERINGDAEQKARALELEVPDSLSGSYPVQWQAEPPVAENIRVNTPDTDNGREKQSPTGTERGAHEPVLPAPVILRRMQHPISTMRPAVMGAGINQGSGVSSLHQRAAILQHENNPRTATLPGMIGVVQVDPDSIQYPAGMGRLEMYRGNQFDWLSGLPNIGIY